MEQNVTQNKNGMTLIEVMLAMVILMVVSLALMQTALLGMRENLKNAMREEAVNLADQRMNELRSMLTDTIVFSGPTETTVSRAFRAANVTFTVKSNPTKIDGTTTQIDTSVEWHYPPGQNYSHSVTTIVRK